MDLLQQSHSRNCTFIDFLRIGNVLTHLDSFITCFYFYRCNSSVTHFHIAFKFISAKINTSSPKEVRCRLLEGCSFIWRDNYFELIWWNYNYITNKGHYMSCHQVLKKHLCVTTVLSREKADSLDLTLETNYRLWCNCKEKSAWLRS